YTQSKIRHHQLALYKNGSEANQTRKESPDGDLRARVQRTGRIERCLLRRQEIQISADGLKHGKLNAQVLASIVKMRRPEVHEYSPGLRGSGVNYSGPLQHQAKTPNLNYLRARSYTERPP